MLSRSVSGRVQQLRVVGPRGQLILTGRELRQRLSLKSTLVDFERVTALQRPQLKPLPALPVVATAPAAARRSSRIERITASVTSSVTSSRTGSVTPSVENNRAARRPLLRTSVPSLLPASVAKLPAEGWQLLVRGQGYGHGVGMSQWGAHGMAEQGADFRTILRHYYRGADVVPFRAIHDPALAIQPPVAPLWRG